VDGAARAAEVYVSAVGLVSEAADVVLTVHELSEGNITAAVGLVPFIPAGVLDNAVKVIVRTSDGVQSLARFIRVGRRIMGEESGLGFIARRRMAIKGYNVNGRMRLVLGTAQETGPGDEIWHAELVGLLAVERVHVGDVEWVTMNRSFKTATGLDDLGPIGRRRPDVIAVRADG